MLILTFNLRAPWRTGCLVYLHDKTGYSLSLYCRKIIRGTTTWILVLQKNTRKRETSIANRLKKDKNRFQDKKEIKDWGRGLLFKKLYQLFLGLCNKWHDRYLMISIKPLLLWTRVPKYHFRTSDLLGIWLSRKSCFLIFVILFLTLPLSFPSFLLFNEERHFCEKM